MATPTLSLSPCSSSKSVDHAASSFAGQAGLVRSATMNTHSNGSFCFSCRQPLNMDDGDYIEVCANPATYYCLLCFARTSDKNLLPSSAPVADEPVPKKPEEEKEEEGGQVRPNVGHVWKYSGTMSQPIDCEEEEMEMDDFFFGKNEQHSAAQRTSNGLLLGAYPAGIPPTTGQPSTSSSALLEPTKSVVKKEKNASSSSILFDVVDVEEPLVLACHLCHERIVLRDDNDEKDEGKHEVVRSSSSTTKAVAAASRGPEQFVRPRGPDMFISSHCSHFICRRCMVAYLEDIFFGSAFSIDTADTVMCPVGRSSVGRRSQNTSPNGARNTTKRARAEPSSAPLPPSSCCSPSQLTPESPQEFFECSATLTAREVSQFLSNDQLIQIANRTEAKQNFHLLYTLLCVTAACEDQFGTDSGAHSRSKSKHGADPTPKKAMIILDSLLNYDLQWTLPKLREVLFSMLDYEQRQFFVVPQPRLALEIKLQQCHVDAVHLFAAICNKAEAYSLVLCPPEKQVACFGTSMQYIVRKHPIHDKVFEERREKHGSRWAFHGSETINWFGILHCGLKNFSGTKQQVNGAVYGNGIYLSPSFAMSASYSCRNYGSAGPQLLHMQAAPPSWLPQIQALFNYKPQPTAHSSSASYHMPPSASHHKKHAGRHNSHMLQTSTVNQQPQAPAYHAQQAAVGWWQQTAAVGLPPQIAAVGLQAQATAVGLPQQAAGTASIPPSTVAPPVPSNDPFDAKSLVCVALCEVIPTDLHIASSDIWVQPHEEFVCVRLLLFYHCPQLIPLLQGGSTHNLRSDDAKFLEELHRSIPASLYWGS